MNDAELSPSNVELKLRDIALSDVKVNVNVIVAPAYVVVPVATRLPSTIFDANSRAIEPLLALS